MLISVKNKLLLSLAAALILISASLLLRNILHLEWNLNITAGTPRYFLFGLAFILAADIVINFVLVLLFQSEYIRLWMEMAGYFSPQRWYAVLGGGLLSASEEVFFRGVLIQFMIQTEAIAAVYAILISAAVFGLFHVMINRRLALFSIWAFWEGLVLGGIYVYTGSLPAVMAVHAAHDILGFVLFSLQRERGFFLLREPQGF